MFKNLKIKTRLMLGFLMMALVVAVVGVFTYEKIDEAEQDVIQVTESSLREVEVTTELTSSLMQLQNAVIELMVERSRVLIDPRGKEEAAEKAGEVKEEIFELMEEIDGWLVEARIASEIGLEKANSAEERDGEMEELKHLYMLAEEVKMHEMHVFEFVDLVENDLVAASSYLEDVEEVHYRELLETIKELEKDAKKETRGEVEDVQNFISGLRAQITYGALTMVSLALILGFVISRSIIKPINSLSKVAIGMSKGDLSLRSGFKTKDEIGLLANIFNQMAENVETSQRRLEKQVDEQTKELRSSKVDLEKEIVARTKELSQAKENLERQIKERTIELEKRLEQVQAFSKASVGREKKMIELKGEIKKLEDQLNK